jgi:uncharacterized surface protein with fasciclin (FAS1) repeats
MKTVRLAAVGIAAALASSTLAAPATAGSADKPGNTSLAEVLAADGNRFDRKWGDFDVVERAARYVLAEKPESPVAVLADGDTKLTAFIPTDRGFRWLVKDLTGTAPETEKAAWQAVKSFGADTVETVLLYHVVPGVKINAKKAAASDGAVLTTAQGGTIEVDVKKKGILLVDADTDDADPRVIGKLTDINKGNKQIAHGINRVLRPVNL